MPIHTKKRFKYHWIYYLSGRLSSLVWIGTLVAVTLGYTLWNQVLSIQATPDWSKLITGTELGLQIGVIIALGGITAPITWVEQQSTRGLPKYAAGYTIASTLVLSAAPLIIWWLLQLTPQNLLDAWQPGTTHADLSITFFISLLTQMWWTLGWGLLGQSVAGKSAAIPFASVGFLTLMGLQAVKLFRFFPGGYEPQLPEINLASMGLSLAILSLGIFASTVTRLGTMKCLSGVVLDWWFTAKDR